MNLFETPEIAAFPVTGFKLATWFWSENAYLIVNNTRPGKGNLNLLADETFHNFTLLTHSLTNNIEYLKQRAILYEKAVDELKCNRRIKRGRGVVCELDKEKGYAVPICLLDYKRSFCGCDGKSERSCPYGFNSLQQCRSSALIRCCVEECKRSLDLVILMDSSASIKLSEFNKQKTFIKNLINKLEIGPDSTRVSIVKFSTYVEVITNLTSFMDKDNLLNEIDNIEHDSGVTNTVLALNITNQYILQENNGMRPAERGVPRVVIVITDGKSTENPELTVPLANKIKERGINIICIGIGKEIDEDELNGIASSIDNVYEINNFDQFGSIIDSLTRTTCQQSANIALEKEIKTKIEKNEYKFFKLNLIETDSSNNSNRSINLNKNSQEKLSIELNNIKGLSRLYYSFDDENPKDSSEYLQAAQTDDNQNFIELRNQNLNKNVVVPQNGSKYVYLGVKGIQNENEFNIKITKIINKSQTNFIFNFKILIFLFNLYFFNYYFL